MLLALAGRLDHRDEQGNETGQLDTPANVAWHLRVKEDELQADLEAFRQLRMIEQHDGILFVTNYGKRQAKPPSARPEAVRNRVAEWRERQRNEDVTSLQQGVTPSDTDTDTEKNRVDEEDAATGTVFKAWQSARGGATTAMDVEIIGDLIDEFTAEWVTAAIKEANSARQDKLPSINFLRAILDRWKRQGFKAPFDAKANREKNIKEDDEKKEAERTKRKMERWKAQHGIG